MRLYEVIYQVLEDVQSALLGMLKPEFEEVVTGEAEVREVFSVPRVGKVAGCYVRNGTITRGSKVRFLREGVVIWNGAIASLRRFKDDVREVQSGLRVRHRPRELPGPQAGRRHRDLRPQGDRTRVAPRPRPECRLSGPRSARAASRPVACAAPRRPRESSSSCAAPPSSSSSLALVRTRRPARSPLRRPARRPGRWPPSRSAPTPRPSRRSTFDKPFTVKKTRTGGHRRAPAPRSPRARRSPSTTCSSTAAPARSSRPRSASTPASLVLDTTKTATQLVTSLTGKTVGSRVLVAIAPKDGLAKRLNHRRA